MTHYLIDDEIRLTPVRECTRFRCRDENFLFRDATPDEVRERYHESVGFVRQRLAPRWKAAGGDAFPTEDFGILTQRIALRAMYFYFVNALPVKLDALDVDGVDSRRIIRDFAEDQFGEANDRAVEFASTLAGTTPHDFRQWMVGDDLFQER